jgi:hypothetical protein
MSDTLLTTERNSEELTLDAQEGVNYVMHGGEKVGITSRIPEADVAVPIDEFRPGERYLDKKGRWVKDIDWRGFAQVRVMEVEYDVIKKTGMIIAGLFDEYAKEDPLAGTDNKFMGFVAFIEKNLDRYKDRIDRIIVAHTGLMFEEVQEWTPALMFETLDAIQDVDADAIRWAMVLYARTKKNFFPGK